MVVGKKFLRQYWSVVIFVSKYTGYSPLEMVFYSSKRRSINSMNLKYLTNSNATQSCHFFLPKFPPDLRSDFPPITPELIVSLDLPTFIHHTLTNNDGDCVPSVFGFCLHGTIEQSKVFSTKILPITLSFILPLMVVLRRNSTSGLPFEFMEDERAISAVHECNGIITCN